MKKGAVDLEKIIKEKGIKLIPFNFEGKIKSLCVNIKDKWYIGYDKLLDEKNKRFFIAKELGNITYFNENNEKSGHITAGDYNTETYENKIKQVHIDKANEFIDFIENKLGKE